MQIIKILSILIVNNMAIVRMKYSDGKKSLDYDVTNSVEQVFNAVEIFKYPDWIIPKLSTWRQFDIITEYSEFLIKTKLNTA